MDKQVSNNPKVNYQLEMDEILKKITESKERPSLLIHSCCGPCSSYCLSYLRDYFDITVFYYNPNIFPEEEYDHRLAEQVKIIDALNKEPETLSPIFFISLPYVHEEFTDYVKGLESEREGGARCRKCFELRIGKTADLAREKSFDYFCTTLTVSPHKNAFIINEVGKESAENNENPLWLVSDFKKRNGYKISIDLSKKYDLYRQQYCGCEFSL